MNKSSSLLLVLPLLFVAESSFSQSADPQMVMTKSIIKQALVNGKSYNDLGELCANGPRLTGSDGAEKAANWGKAKMESYGFDRVFLQPVTVPKWVRGKNDQVSIVEKGKKPVSLSMCSLGLSPGTPKSGLSAEVIEVHSLKEVDSLGFRVKGKIVFYNRAFDESLVNTMACYGGAADQRSAGPSAAGKYGAAGVLVRSMTNRLDDVPHTGMVHYIDSIPKIPAAAISTKAAELLSQKLKTNPKLTISMKMDCRNEAAVVSHNVIGEIRGSEFPDEIILVGGHLDSWDLAQGAHDDGAGVVQSIEVLRLLKSLNYKPKRTLRAVLFMSEEVGGIGGKEYARQAELNHENHISANESDRGGFTPRGHSIELSDSLVEKYKTWKKYFEPIYADMIIRGGGGVDISFLKKFGTHMMGYVPDSQRYFDVHHASTDTFESVNKRELELGAAAMTIMTYLIDQNGRF